MNGQALLCTALTAVTMVLLFDGNVFGALVFGFLLLVQLVGAIGNPDATKKATGDKADGKRNIL